MKNARVVRFSLRPGIFLLILLITVISITVISSRVKYIQGQKIGMNEAIGANVDISAMLPDTPYTLRTVSGGNFFDLAVHLGINTVRITDMRWEMTGTEYPASAWQYVFDEAASHHMRIILLLLDGDGGRSVIQQAHTLLGYDGLAKAPSLWMVDLYNEPDVSDTHLTSVLRDEAAYVRSVAPSKYITIGGWKTQVPGHPGDFDWQDPAAIPRFINLVDVVSPHLYGFDEKALLRITPQEWTGSFLNKVREKSQHKPILLEEFGVSNGLATTTSSTITGSPAWQESVYWSVLQEVRRESSQNVIGALAWIMAPRPAWPNDLQGDMTGWAFVLDRGHRLLAAASVFSGTTAHA
jgi:hypothetical protein